MTGEGIPDELATAPVPAPDAAAPQAHSGSGAETALKAMLRKRQMRAGNEPAERGEGNGDAKS